MDLLLERASDGRGDEVRSRGGVRTNAKVEEERVSMACSKVVSGSAKVWSNTFRARNNCLQQNGCGSELPPQRSWFYNPEEPSGGSKADYHSAMRDCVLGGET